MHRSMVVSALVFLRPANKTAVTARDSWLKGYIVGCRAAARQIFSDLRRHSSAEQWRAALDFARRHNLSRQPGGAR